MRTFLSLFAVILTAITTGCGSKTQFQDFTSPDGSFSCSMCGKARKEVMTYGVTNFTMYGNASNGEEYAAGNSDSLPPSFPDFMVAAKMDEVVNSFLDGGGSFTTRSGVLNGMGYRDFEFSSEKYGGSVCGRIMAARGRLYLIYAGGKSAKRSNKVVTAFLDSFKLIDGPTPGRSDSAPPNTTDTPGPNTTASVSKPKPDRPSGTGVPGSTAVAPTPDPNPMVIKPEPANPGPGVGGDDPPPQVDPFRPQPQPPVRPGREPRPNRPQFGDKPQMVGSVFGQELQDSAPEGGLLVGFDVGFAYKTNSNNDVICAVRPIFRVDDKEQLGQIHGVDTRRAIKDVAKPGYAVGAIHAKGGFDLDGFYITYMKITGKQLDPNDSYNSIWLGGAEGEGPKTMGGDGRLVVGMIGRMNNNGRVINAIGLDFGPAPAEFIAIAEKARPAPPRIPKFPRFVGGWGDPEFRDEAPPGGILVGFEIAPGPGNSIATVRPNYQVKGKDKDVPGFMHGSQTKRGVKERAKPGYAVGAINVKGGLWVDGMSITYMKIIDDIKLDPTDKYESIWYGNGNATGNDVSIITGEGELAIGILGRQSQRDLNALGLLFKTPEPGKPGDDKK
jgi:hypothetical protein